MRTRSRVLATLFALGLVAAACGGDDDDDAASGDTTAAPETATTAAAGGDTTAADETGAGGSISIALGSEPTSLDPHIVDDGGERAINDNVYETLLARDPEGELQPGLADALPTQVDDVTWEFTLRDGVTFHDGTPFNADSVVASIDRIVKLVAEEKTDNSGFYGTLVSAEKVDDLTVRITTSEPDGVLPARMYWLKMIPASAVASEDLSENPVGTGPYQFVEFNRGENVTLEAYPDYWDGAPSITQVTYEFVGESSTRLSGLLSEQYDLITNLAPQDAERAPQTAQVQGQEHPLLILDVDEGVTADPNVRKALNLAVDKEAIVESLFGGFATLDAGQVLSPSILGFNESLEAYPYDPDQAQQLIETAGVAGHHPARRHGRAVAEGP